MIGRRIFVTGGASLLASGQLVAQGRTTMDAAAYIEGEPKAANMARFVSILRRHLNRMVMMNVFIDRPAQTTAAFSAAPDSGGDLVLRGGGATVRVMGGGFSTIPSTPVRHVLSGFYDVFVDRTDGDPRIITLQRTEPRTVRGTVSPKITF
jgi:hypothetical protein